MTHARPILDPPEATELMRLVAEFLATELAPAQADAKLRYRTLVAASLLRIARRELAAEGALATGPDGYAAAPELLAAAGSLTDFTAELADGRRSLTEPATYALAERHVAARLAVAEPEALKPA